MANLSSFYPQPVVKGTTAGTYAEGNDSRIVGALPAATAGTGSVLASGSNTARTLSARFAETVKVADFGAVGDGITDDTLAIQAAINYAVSIGNAVIEFEPKRYLLEVAKVNTVDTNFDPNNNYKNYLQIVGGTTSLKLFFRGNGAELYTNKNDATDPNFAVMMKIRTRFDSILFDNLNFTRGPARITTSSWTLQELFLTVACVSDDEINKLSFVNCTFTNVTFFLNASYSYGLKKVYGKLKEASFINCQFLYPYGSNRTAQVTGGGAGVSCIVDTWVDRFVFIGTRIDMAYNDGVIPNDCAPRDGFCVYSGLRPVFDSCTIENCNIEGLILGPTGYAMQVNSFVVPSVGSNVVMTFASSFGNQPNGNPAGGGSLNVGEKFYLLNGCGSISQGNFAGVYETVVGGPLLNGQSITAKRLPDSNQEGNPNMAVTAPVGSTITPCGFGLIMNLLDPILTMEAKVVNCSFRGRDIVRENGQFRILKINITNGGTGYVNPPTVTVGGAAATAVISGGQVESISVPWNQNNPLEGWFTSLPSVVITGGGGQGATAVAVRAKTHQSPCIVSETRCLIENNSFINDNTCLSITNWLPVSGPTIVRGNYFYAQNAGLNSFIGTFQARTEITNNNFIISKYDPEVLNSLTYNTTDALSGMGIVSFGLRSTGYISNNTAEVITPVSSGGSRFTNCAVYLTAGSNAKDIIFKGNTIKGFSHGIYAQNTIVSVDEIEGSVQGQLGYNTGIKIKNQKVPISITKRGWLRLNYGIRPESINSGIFKLGAFQLLVAKGDGSSRYTLSVLSSDGSMINGEAAITAARLLADGTLGQFVDIFVAQPSLLSDVKFLELECNGSLIIGNAKESQNVTSITGSGNNAIFTCNNHGLLAGMYIFLSGTNSVPEINGSRFVSSVTNNTFTIDIGTPVLTSGTTGEFIPSLQRLEANDKGVELDIKNIVADGSDALVFYNSNNLIANGVNQAIPAIITGSNSTPSIDGIKTLLFVNNGVGRISGTTITTAGNSGKIYRIQDYLNPSIVAELNWGSDTSYATNQSIAISNSKIYSGANAPSISAPNGSLYLRTDGAADTTLYVRSGGAWTALTST